MAAPAVDARTPSVAHRVEYGAMRAVIGALGALSWDRATRAGARVGALGYRPFGIRRGVVERQIAAALPALPEHELRRIARGAFEHLGRVAVETALLSRLGRDDVLALFEDVQGWEVVRSLLARGRGLIMVTGHLGNWELGGAWIAAQGVPLDVVARRMGNPLFDAYLGRTRGRLGMTVVRDRDAVRRTPRALRAGGAVAFLTDQAGLHLASTFVPFFGRPAKTPRGPAVFALRLGVPVVFGVALRRPSGRYRLAFEEIPAAESGDRERDVDQLVASYTTALERWVREAPEQYLWHHRRWKQQPADTPSELRDPA
ncbi:MAG TPA: lysophospholipid acyltransferase family protein [Gemmatimonadaceae bacterium]